MELSYGWVIHRIDGFRHIVPTDELHAVDNCHCQPVEDDYLVIHNSFDGREKFERGERKVS